MAVQKFNNYIDGKWSQPSSGQYFKNINPANRDDIIGEYPLSTRADVDAAIMSAHKAFLTWGRMTANEREKYLYRFLDLLDQNKEKIGEMLCREEGKTLKEAVSEPSRSSIEGRYVLGEGQRMEGITMPSDRKGIVSVAERMPIGVVAAIAPWNMPVLTPMRKFFPALAMGNTAVFKPASDTPHSAVMLMQLVEQAELPPGVINMVIGKGGEIGDAIAQNPLVRGITFTGSTNVGKRIARMAAENFTRLQLEMGGKNPALVADYKNLKKAAAELASSGLAVSGQRCTALSRIIVLEKEADQFEQYLIESAKNDFVVGDGMNPQVNVGPIINDKAGNDIMAWIQSARDEGAVIAAGGRQLTGGIFDKGFYIEPTVITGVKPGMKVAVDEIFGPVLSVIRAKDFDEAVSIANNTKYGLAASIYTDNLEYIYRFQKEVESGMVHINHPTVTDGTMPFGGIKQSGIGPFSKGKTNRDMFTQLKVVYTKFV
jgi:aldehyde dehydrogenase (NAD+)